MALFDRLVADDDTTKVVDLGHEAFESFFALAQQIGFAEEARRRGIAPAILFVITPDRTSVEAYRSLRSRFAAGDAGAGAQRDCSAPPSIATNIRRRAAARCRCGSRCWRRACADTSRSRRSRFRIRSWPMHKDMPLDVHIELQRWLRKIYLEFRELDLRILLADLQSSIRL